MQVHSSDIQAEILPLGLDGMLVRFATQIDDAANRNALKFLAKAQSASIEGIVETASSLTSVYLRFRPDILPRATLEQRVQQLLQSMSEPGELEATARTLWRIPAAFAGTYGPDLKNVAKAADLHPDDAVQSICNARLRVLALGFAPGQPYLGFLPENWNIPRRSDGISRVPQGSVVVAVRQVITYANAAPTGWHRIGQTAFRCFNADRDPAVVLSPGDEVEFTAVTHSEFEAFGRDERGLGGATQEPLT